MPIKLSVMCQTTDHCEQIKLIFVTPLALAEIAKITQQTLQIVLMVQKDLY